LTRSKTILGAVWGFIKSYAIGLGLLLVIVGLLIRGVNSTARVSRDEQKRMLEDNIRRAVVACYAMEGSFPESLNYLKVNYKLNYDEKKFMVDYTAFGANLMPSVHIVDLGGGE
jgi:hypothetical protein